MLNTEMSSSCRTCMKNDANLVHLFESVKIEENNLQLVELLMECTAVQVSLEDGLPQKICEECCKALHISFSFRQQASKADEQFKRLLEEQVKLEIKVEDEPDYFDDFNDSQLEMVESLNDIKIEVPKIEENKMDDEKVEPNSIFSCYQCNKKFTKENKYLKHLDSHVASFQCIHCNKQFQRERSLQKHLCKQKQNSGICTNRDNESQPDSYTVMIKNENGKTEKKFECHECEMSFKKHSFLVSHLKKHARGNFLTPFICDTCGKDFISKAMLKRHLKLHYKEKPYKCTMCDKSYSRNDQLKLHMNKHTDYKPNVCPHCSKAFVQVCSLKDHIRTHTKETPYLCSECGKGFANSSNLRQHMFRHTGAKPHVCKLCPKSFCTKGQMTTHMTTHTGAHPYKCEKCGAAFTKLNSLKKHALIHSGQKPYGCETCLMRFTCKDHLKRHCRIHTGEKPYKCKFCERAFTQSNDLVKHMRSHLGQNIYKCTVCGEGFRLQSELKQHYPIHFCGDDPALKNLLNIDHKPVLTLPEQNAPSNQVSIQEQLINSEARVVPKGKNVDLLPDRPREVKELQTDKFLITINSVDNMVAINIEPEPSN